VEEFGYEKLGVLQKAMDLVDDIYVATRGFPKEELYGLASQMRRAAVSIPSNISEGYGLGKKHFCAYLRSSRASAFELRTQIDVARRQLYLQSAQATTLTSQAVEVAKMIDGLISSQEKN
jgi:four helix bundle protein